MHVQSHHASPITPAVPAPKAYPLAAPRSKAQAVALYHARYSRVNPLRAVSTRDIGVQTMIGGGMNNGGGKGSSMGRWIEPAQYQAMLAQDDDERWQRSIDLDRMDNKGKGKKGDSLFLDGPGEAASSSWQ